MASTAAAAKAPADAAAPAPKKSKLMLIIVIAVVLLAGGGGGAWYYMKSKAAAGEEEEAPKPSAKASVFVPLEQFVVNLQPDDGPQFLQTQMTLKVVDQSASDLVKSHMPEVRNRVLLLLSSKKPSQLTTRDGKRALSEEISAEIDAVIAPPKPVKKAKKAKAKAKKKGAEEADAEDEADAKGKKSKAKAKAKPAEDEEEAHEPAGLVLDVLFTHFIIQ